jgi:lysozyme family protein
LSEPRWNGSCHTNDRCGYASYATRTGLCTNYGTKAMTATSAEAFTTWCNFLAPTEGGLSMAPYDPGNWTGGKVGVGILKGTKFGIAASSHPGLDIANLTIEEANALRKNEYWDKVSGDNLPAAFAFLVADAAYGSGPNTAAEEFQAMLGVAQDGRIGPKTLVALTEAMAKPSAYTLASGTADLLCEFNSRRLLFEAGLSNWKDAEGGWTRRLFHSLTLALSLV